MDVQTVAIGIGLVVSLLFTEVFGLAVGGMIVPGYIALSLHHPPDVIATLCVSLMTYGVVTAISKFAFVYGRRKVVLMVLCGFVLGSLVRAAPVYAATSSSIVGSQAEPLYCVIGCIIPGLIALWIDRQGLMETLAPLLTSAVVVRLVLILIGMEILI
jgi:poly-gamma-glutamate biosynthesis protein PgsC/CapC